MGLDDLEPEGFLQRAALREQVSGEPVVTSSSTMASNVSLSSPATWNVGMNRRPSMRNKPAEAPRKRPAQADNGQFSQ